MRRPPSRIDRCLLRPVTFALLRAHRGAVGHSRVVVFGVVVLVVAVVPQIPKMRVHLSIREMIDSRMIAANDMARMEASFGAAHPFVLLFRPPEGTEGFDTAQSRALVSWIEGCARRPEVARVRSPLQVVRVVDGSDGLEVEARVPDLTPASLAELAGTPWHGVVTDLDCRDVAVEIVLRSSEHPTRFGDFDPAPVGELLESARTEFCEPLDAGEVHAAGAAAFEYHSLRGIRRFRLLNVAVVALLLLFARMSLGTWRAGPLLLVPLGVASAVVYGGMALRGDPIDLLSTGLFLLLAVAGIEDFYFLSRLRMQSGDRWRAPFRRLLLPGFLTSLTTVLGFGSLLVSDLEIVRRLGLWAAVGALVEWAATFLVLPAVLQAVPAARGWTDRRRAWRIDWLESLARVRWPRPVGLGLLGVLVAGGIGAFHLEFSDSPERTFDRSHPYRKATEELRSSRGWAGTFSVVSPPVAGNSANDFEPEWERLDDTLRVLRPWQSVTAIVDPELALDDLTGGRLAWLDELFDMEAETPALDFADLAASDGGLRAQVFVADLGLESVAFLRDVTRSAGAESGVYPAGELIAYADFAEAVPRALLRSLVLCLVLVGALIAIVVRARGGAPTVPVLAAAAWGPALVLGLMSVLSVPVNFLTCVFASVLVGLTGDNALQYLCAAPSDSNGISEGAARRGAASIQIASIMALCSLVFLGSAFVASRRLGLLLGLGLVASLIGDLFVLRSILGPGGRAR